MTQVPSRSLRRAALLAAVTAVQIFSALPAGAQSNPVSIMNGSWAGGGSITLASGARERVNCRGAYSAPGGPGFTLALRCASDSYTFDFRATGNYTAGAIAGQWDESFSRASGTFTGTARGAYLEARAESTAFSAVLGMSTHGNRQSIAIRSPGNALSEVNITMSRR